MLIKLYCEIYTHRHCVAVLYFVSPLDNTPNVDFPTVVLDVDGPVITKLVKSNRI